VGLRPLSTFLLKGTCFLIVVLLLASSLFAAFPSEAREPTETPLPVSPEPYRSHPVFPPSSSSDLSGPGGDAGERGQDPFELPPELLARSSDFAGDPIPLMEPRAALLTDLIGAARRDETPSRAARYSVSVSDLREYADGLFVLRALYLQALAEARKLRDTEGKRRAVSVDRLAEVSALPPPYTLSYYDLCRDKLDDLEREIDEDSVLRRTTRTQIEGNRAYLGTVRAKQKSLLEQLNQEIRTKGERASLEWKLRSARLEEQCSLVAGGALRIRLATLEGEGELFAGAEKTVRAWVDSIRRGVEPNSSDLKAQLDRLEEATARFSRRAERDARKLEELGALADRLRSEPLPVSSVGRKAREADLAALDLLKKAYGQMEDQARQGEQVMLQARQTWERRNSLLRGNEMDSKIIKGWAEEDDDWRTYIRETVPERQKLLVYFQNRVEAISGEDPEEDGEEGGRFVPLLVRALAEAKEETLDSISGLLALGRLQDRLDEEIDVKIRESGWFRALGFLLTQEGQSLWNRDLWTMEDDVVTVGKILEALTILLVGIFLTNRGSRMAKSRIHRSAKQDIHVAILAQQLLYYAFIFAVGLLALRIVHIPLTAFAFLGGAVAIGVGVGAQDFFRNLIGGLMLMVEKPIRIRDIIEIDGEFALVKAIESRTTHVRTFDGVDLFLPNSHLLEAKIRNRTYSGRSVKAKLSLYTPYGVPVGEIRRILLDLAAAHPRVLKDPAPYARFADCQEGALLFRLYFFLSQEELVQAGRIMEDTLSDLRTAVMEALEAAGIDVAPVQWIRRVLPDVRNPS
jgi:small-conductance mechanosensitive channel